MNIKKTTFFTIILIPVLANAYTTNTSTCTNDCAQAGCGLSQNSICTICPMGTYSTDGSPECTSCGATLPTDENATFAWYNNGATSRDECTFKYTCNDGTIDTKANNSQLTNTNGIHIDNINDYLSPCVKCGTNTTPTQNECACNSGTHVKGESSTTTTTTTSADCVPYILSLNLNDPNTPNTQKPLNALTTLNSSTQQYTTPSGILLSGTTDIDTNLTTPNGTTTIRKIIWGKNGEILDKHIDTGYKITGWKTSGNISIDANNITANHELYPEWTPKQFQVNSDGKNLSVYKSNGEQIASQQCTYTTPCYVMAPTKSGHTFQYWTCKTTNYAGKQINCTQENVFAGTNISEISYGNNITLTPQWEANTIEIIYMADYQTSETKAYTYGDDSQNQIESFDSLFANYTKPAGKEFAYWVCTSCSPQVKVNAYTTLPNTFTKNTYILQANFAPASYNCDEGTYLPKGQDTCAPCPQGYYCPGVEDDEYDENADHGLSPCPAGTTSAGTTSADTTSKSITDCYITNQTKICDNSGYCFQIPTDIKLNLTQ